MSIKTLYRLDNPKHNLWATEGWFVKPIEINKETTKSWILDEGYQLININKKSLLGTPDKFSGIQERFFESEQDAKDYLWWKEHRSDVYRAFERCTNIDKLLKIAQILEVRSLLK